MNEFEKLTKKELICIITDILSESNLLVDKKTVNRWLRMKKLDLLIFCSNLVLAYRNTKL